MRTRILRGDRADAAVAWTGATLTKAPAGPPVTADPSSTRNDPTHGRVAIDPAEGQRLLRPHGATQAAAEAPTRFEFRDYESHGADVVAAAKAEAARIVEQARQQAAGLVATEKARIERETRSEIEQRATQSAVATMRQELSGELGSLTSALAGLHSQLTQERANLAAAWEANLRDVTLAAAEAIVGRQIETQPTITDQWLAEAVALAVDWPEITVRVAPEDLERLQTDAPAAIREVGGDGRITFVADPTVPRGGCLLRSRYGEIEQTLTARVARLREEWDG